MASRDEREWLGSKLQADRGGFRSLDFTGVSTRAFPLRASGVQLQKFCDQYLNLEPKIASFRPVAPLVLFQVLNYGRMSPTTKNLGWVAQHEVLFLVPVVGRWYESGKRVRGFASVTPFIFVDNDWSISSGRQIYGWPKYPAELVPEVNSWIQDPRLDQRLLRLKTPLFPKLYAGRPQEMLTLLDLYQSPEPFGQWPPDMGNMMQPWSQMSQMWGESMAGMPEMFRNMSQMWSPEGSREVNKLMQQQMKALRSVSQKTFVNTVNLKQFRSSNPEEAAYQSLVNGVMEVTRNRASGTLGTMEMLRGDPSCGFSLMVHQYPDFPIVEALGLEVDSVYSAGGVTVSAIKPFFPYWTLLDMRYHNGKRLLWRTRTTGWAKESDPPPADPPESPALFNSALGPVVEAVRGPFDFYDATIRILPLKTKEVKKTDDGKPKVSTALRLIGDQLRESLTGAVELFFPEHTNTPEIDVEFMPWVFVLVKKFGPMSSKANNLGWWGGRNVDFARILKVKLKNDEQEYEIPFVLIPNSFANNPLAVSAGSEVLGLPTTFARIEPGVDPWIESRTAAMDRCLMNVTVRDYPALSVGQEASERCLFSIHELPRASASPKVSKADKEVAKLMGSIRKKFEPGGDYKDGVMLSYLTLKQFRDEEKPELICYRALEGHERLIGKWSGRGESSEFEALDGSYEIRINDLPSWPVIETLGLEVDRWEVNDQGGKVAICKVHHPHWAKADLRWNLPMTLRWQSVDGEWRPESLPPEMAEEFGDKPVSVGNAYLGWLSWKALTGQEMSSWDPNAEKSEGDEFAEELWKEVFSGVEDQARRLIAPYVDLSTSSGKPIGLSDLLRDFERAMGKAES